MGKKQVLPIKPREVAAVQRSQIPPEVIEVFNELIAKELSSNSAVVQQEDVVKRIVEKMGVERKEIFDGKWLNIEAIFRNAGWKVEYDSPGYSETYGAKFIFTKNKKS